MRGATPTLADPRAEFKARVIHLEKRRRSVRTAPCLQRTRADCRLCVYLCVHPAPRPDHAADASTEGALDPRSWATPRSNKVKHSGSPPPTPVDMKVHYSHHNNAVRVCMMRGWGGGGGCCGSETRFYPGYFDTGVVPFASTGCVCVLIWHRVLPAASSHPVFEGGVSPVLCLPRILQQRDVERVFFLQLWSVKMRITEESPPLL